MSIVTVILVILLLGFLAWAVGFLPIPAPFEAIIRGIFIFIAIAVLVIWALGAFGVSGAPHLNLR